VHRIGAASARLLDGDLAEPQIEIGLDPRSFGRSPVSSVPYTYWGWGCEDSNLKPRCGSAGIRFARRKGSFQALDHDNAGDNLDATQTPGALANGKRLKDRWAGRPRRRQTD